MDQVENVFKPLKVVTVPIATRTELIFCTLQDFFVASDRLLRKCTKPDRKGIHSRLAPEIVWTTLSTSKADWHFVVGSAAHSIVADSERHV